MKFYKNYSCRLTACLEGLLLTTDLGPPWLSASIKRQIIMSIKLIFVLTFAAIMQVSASSFAQRITISEKNAPLEKVFKTMRAQSGYDFLFDAQVLKKTAPVTINLKNASLTEALSACLEGQDLTFSIEENTVLIKERSFFGEVKTKLAQAFNLNSIGGRVTNTHGEGLAGATVMVKRTKKAVNTNHVGIFIHKDVEPSDTLVCSFIGYKTRKVAVGKESYFDIQLEEATNALDAIVIQAYGQTTQRLTTGNIARVTAADIEKQQVFNPLMALQGRVAGLVVTPSGGYKSGPIKVELRGRNSINPAFTSDPLYIIDGVPLTVLDIGTRRMKIGGSTVSPGIDQTGLSAAGGVSPLATLNPADIESIEVLKDADATAIYGSRGGNGVILITTKKGKAGKNIFNLSVGQGVQTVIRDWQMLSSDQYLEMRREAFKNDHIVPTAVQAPDLLIYDPKRYTDWQKFSWGGKGQWTNAEASLSGGNETTTFRVSTGLSKTKGISAAKGGDQKASGSVNLFNRSLDNRLIIGLNASYSNLSSDEVTVTSPLLPPNGPDIYDEKGGLNYIGWTKTGTSIFSDFKDLLSPHKSTSNALMSSLNLDYNVFKQFHLKLNLGYSNSRNDQDAMVPIAALSPFSVPKATGTHSIGNSKVTNFIMEPQAEYNLAYGKSSLNALIGGTLQQTNSSSLMVSGYNYTDDALLRTIANAPDVVSFNQQGIYKYAGVFARIGYNYDNKYILNLNGRRDGSSRFSPENRFGNFGSVGAAWILSKEKWIARNLPTVVSFLKLRGSYGITGGDNVGEYQYLSQWANNPDSGYKPYGNGTVLLPQIQPNIDFHWQVNKKLEGAMSLGFFKDRVNLDLSWYRNRCNNQLLFFPTAGFTGFSGVTANTPANVQNTGLEMSLGAVVLESKNFTWRSSFNIGKNDNKLLSYPNLDQSPFKTLFKVRQSLNTTYVFHFTGVDPQTGQYTFQDWNNDGKITAIYSGFPGEGADDRFMAINLAPKFQGGMTNNFTYKNFSLDFNLVFTKQKGYNATATGGTMSNIPVYVYENSWRKPGDQALFAKFSTQSNEMTSNFLYSDAMLTDASFIRLQTVAMSYRFPDQITKKIGVRNLSLNLSAQNIFVLTNYKGLDPETQSFGSLPQVRTVTAGLNCSF